MEFTEKVLLFILYSCRIDFEIKDEANVAVVMEHYY